MSGNWKREIRMGMRQGLADLRRLPVFLFWFVPSDMVMIRFDEILRHRPRQDAMDAVDWLFCIPAIAFAEWRTWLWEKERKEQEP